MRALLEQQLSLTPGNDLHLLLDRAWQVQQLRDPTRGRVTRTSLLYAAATIEPLVLALLETNGLRFREWEQDIGLVARPGFESEAKNVDYNVSDPTSRAMQMYRERWPKRPLDPLGVMAAILLVSVGDAHSAFDAGLESTAAKRASRFVDASPNNALIDPVSLGFQLSTLAQQVVRAAGQLIRERKVGFAAVTSSELLIVLTQPIGEAPTAPDFLRGWLAKKVGEKQLADAIQKWMAFYHEGEISGPLRWTQPVAAICERARVLAGESAAAEQIAARHLVGAVIAAPRWAASSGVPGFLEELRIDPHELTQSYFSYLQAAPVRDRRDNMGVWRRFLGLRDETAIARFNAEEVGGPDLLRIRENVNAFASLIASKRIDPPLSIGLFGNWGSGKSFFMAKVRAKVAEYAQRAQGRPDSIFHDRIVQIEFNAWHYGEANLWASMVEHLFRNLKLTHEKDSDKAIAERREELLQKLDTLMAERAAAEEMVEKAQLERDRAEAAFQAKKEDVEAKAALAQGIRARDVWEIVSIDATTRAELEKHLQTLGAGRILESTEDVRKTVEELRGVKTRMSILGGWVLRQPRSYILLAILIILAPFGAQALIKLLEWYGADLKEFGKTVTQMSSYVLAITAWLGKRLSSGRSLLDQVDAARKKIDAHIETAEQTRQKEIAAADSQLTDATNQVAAARENVEKMDEAVLEARNELLTLTNSYRLARFIDERAASDDYRKLLGVLATVRHDFSMLSELMYGEQFELSENARIDRIVLYIDDLDRCDPENVIHVLNAVHLLLAFKLFVVVVGVDARRIATSLARKHSLGAMPEQQADEFKDAEPTWHDYVEKIFQVPFWLEPMSWQTASSYIGTLLTDDVRRPQQTVPPLPNVQPASGDENAATAGPETRIARYTLGKEESPEADPQQLSIDEKERDYMQSEALARLVSRSPRTAKRFVNTYRFFRAALPASFLDDYLNEENGAPPYKCTLLLLAIVVGAPDVALKVLNSIKDGDATERVTAFAAALTGNTKHDQWEAVRGALTDFEGGRVALGKLMPYVDRVSRYSFIPPYVTMQPVAMHATESKLKIQAEQSAKLRTRKTRKRRPPEPPS